MLAPPPLFEVNGKIMWQLRKDIADEEICPTVKRIADKMGVKYIDMHSVFENKKELFSDGVNAHGIKALAQKVFEVVKDN